MAYLRLKFGVYLILVWVIFTTTSFAEVYIGYAYPGVVQPGSNVLITLGGQKLMDVQSIHSSHPDIKVEIESYQRFLPKKEINRLMRRIESMEAELKAAKTENKIINIKKQLRKIRFLYEHRWRMPSDDDTKTYMKRLKGKFQPNAQLEDRLTVRIFVPEGFRDKYLELRAESQKGYSNPQTIGISNRKPIIEIEPNDFFKEAMNIGYSSIQLNGQILPGDIDLFQFNLKKGQVLTADLQARRLIPYLADAVPGWFQAILTLYDDKGQTLICEDDADGNPDPVLVYRSPINQTVTLEVRDAIYRGREDFVYSIAIGDIPYIQSVHPLGAKKGDGVQLALYGKNLPQSSFLLETKELPVGSIDLRSCLPSPLSQSPRPLPFFITKRVSQLYEKLPELETPQGLIGKELTSFPITIDGTFNQNVKWHIFTFKGSPGQELSINCLARRIGSPVDGELRLIDPHGKMLDMSDDVRDHSLGLTTHHADPTMDVNLSQNGLYTLLLRDLNDSPAQRAIYRLCISPPKPDVIAMVSPSRLNVRKGGHTPFSIHLQKLHGYQNEVRIHLSQAPKGCYLSGNVISSSVEKANLTLYWHENESNIPLDISLFAEFNTSGGPKLIKVIPVEDRMQAFLNRHLVSAKNWALHLGKRTMNINWKNGVDDLKIKKGEQASLELSLPTHKKKNKTNIKFLRFSLEPGMEEFLSLNSELRTELNGSKAFLDFKCLSSKPRHIGNLLVSVKDHRNSKKPRLITHLPALPLKIVP